MTTTLKFVHAADLHLGIDFSLNKWKKGIIQRTNDFFDNFLRIMKRSSEEDIDFLILAGDIYDRSKPRQIITRIVLKEILNLSSKKPIFLIPGNHDKSKINKGLLFLNENVIIFNKPSTLTFLIKNLRVKITGIPFIYNNKIATFEKVIKKPLFPNNFDLKILILHELVETATVGINNFQFTKQMEGVIPLELIDNKFDYVALGHVHKYQKIQNTTSTIIYPGSIERTSVIEREESKGYIITEVEFDIHSSIMNVKTIFNELPTRPIVYQKIPELNEAIYLKIIHLVKQQIKKEQKSPLIYIRIQKFNDYQKYLSLKSDLRFLKQHSFIFDFRISSPDFRPKIARTLSQNRIIKSVD